MILSLVALLLAQPSSPSDSHLKVLWIDPQSDAYRQGLRKGDQVADPKTSLARLYFRSESSETRSIPFLHQAGSSFTVTVKQPDFRDFVLGYSPGGRIDAYERQLIHYQVRFNAPPLQQQEQDPWKLFDSEPDVRIRDWLITSQSVYQALWMARIPGSDATEEIADGYPFHTDGPSLARLVRCGDAATRAFYLLRYSDWSRPRLRIEELPKIDEIAKQLLEPLQTDGCLPEQVHISLLLAIQFAASHNPKADAWFQTAIAKAAGRADLGWEALLTYAKFLHAAHRENEADSAYRRFIASSAPAPAFAVMGVEQYAAYLHEVGREADAETQIRIGLAMNSNGDWGFTFRSELATCIAAQGRYREALPLFEESVDKAPLMYKGDQDYSVIFDMAKGAVTCRLALGDPDGAIAISQRARMRVEQETDPGYGLYDYTACTGLIAQAQGAKGNIAQALDTVQLAIEKIGALSGDQAKLAPAYYVPLYSAKGEVLCAAKDLQGASIAYALALQYAEEARKLHALQHDPSQEIRKKAKPPELPKLSIVPPKPSLSRATSVAPAPAPGDSFAEGKRYALLIATDEYKDFPKLNNPVSDAEAIRDELVQTFGFETTVLRNPSQEQIYQAIGKLGDRPYGPADQLFVFFAGHGTFDETRFKDGMLVCADSKKDDKFFQSYINFEILKQLIDNLPCRHVLLLLDVCFGGTFDEKVAHQQEGSRGTESDADDAAILTRAVRWRTRLVLTSGGKEPVSDGPPGEHSPFASKLLEVFRTEGMRRKFLTFEDLLGPMQHLKTQPIYQQFGLHQPGGSFFFVRK